MLDPRVLVPRAAGDVGAGVDVLAGGVEVEVGVTVGVAVGVGAGSGARSTTVISRISEAGEPAVSMRRTSSAVVPVGTAKAWKSASSLIVPMVVHV